MSVTVALSNNLLAGESGANRLTGNTGSDLLFGAAGADTLTGGQGADLLAGGSGNDSLNAGDGADVLTGGTGQDILNGGAGDDKFVFLATNESGTTAATRDIIADFTAGDIIDLSGIAGATAFSFIGLANFTTGGLNQLRYELVDTGGPAGNDSVLVSLDTDNDTGVEASILLQGYTGSLISSDFNL